MDGMWCRYFRSGLKVGLRNGSMYSVNSCTSIPEIVIAWRPSGNNLPSSRRPFFLSWSSKRRSISIHSSVSFKACQVFEHNVSCGVSELSVDRELEIIKLRKVLDEGVDDGLPGVLRIRAELVDYQSFQMYGTTIAEDACHLSWRAQGVGQLEVLKVQWSRSRGMLQYFDSVTPIDAQCAETR